jgi:hypothetical protein
MFDSLNIFILPNFLISIQIKLYTNTNWYLTDQAKLAYFTSRLRDRTINQVIFGVINIGGFMFKNIPEIIFILKIVYSNIIPKATVGQEILKLY